MNTQEIQKDQTPSLITEGEDRKIVGVFHKQRWEGRRLETLVADGSETFDATRYVLSMSRQDIVVLEDNDYGTDAIGLKFVDWEGPHAVEIVEQIKAFFGIESLHDLTDEMLEKEREHLNSLEKVNVSVVIDFKVNLRIPKPSSAEDLQQLLTEFVENLDYHFESNTESVRVTDTELLEWS